MSWIRLTYCGSTSLYATSKDDTPFSIRSEELQAFRPLKFGSEECSVIYFNNMHVVVRESYEEIRTLLGEFTHSENQRAA